MKQSLLSELLTQTGHARAHLLTPQGLKPSMCGDLRWHVIGRVPTSSGNHGKPGKSLKKSSMHGKIMEFEKTLKNHGKIIEFCEII